MSFTIRTALVVAGAVAAAAVIAPLAAFAPAVAHFPFTRIFDRAVIVALFAGLLWQNRQLKFSSRLRKGFSGPRRSLGLAVRGLAFGLLLIAILLAAAWAMAGFHAIEVGSLAAKAPAFLLGAVVIGTLEESFFRAFLLDGMARDFGDRAALALSAGVYAVAHVIRSPARFELRRFDPTAGFRVLGDCLGQLAHPSAFAAAAVGLFVLGLVLGEAFLLTRNVYFSAGLHTGIVFGVKSWRMLAPHRIPVWLEGYGHQALIGGPAAWLVGIAMLVSLPLMVGRRTA